MRTLKLVALALLLVSANTRPSFAQSAGPILSLDGEQVYTSAATPIRVIGSGLSPSFRIVLDGQEIATTFAAWNMLSAAWPSGSLEGEYDAMVWNANDHSIQSNHVSLILGHARRTAICAGGLLPQSTPVQAILDYEARYDTLNCIYLEPPVCYTGATASPSCTL